MKFSSIYNFKIQQQEDEKPPKRTISYMTDERDPFYQKNNFLFDKQIK